MFTKTGLKEYIHSCRRKTLEGLLKAAGLPTTGLKDSLIVRLANYIDVGPSDEFISEVALAMQTTMSRYSPHPGSSITEMNSGNQPDSNDADTLQLVRVQPNFNPNRMSDLQTTHQHLAQSTLPSGPIGSTNIPLDSQYWDINCQNDGDPHKSGFFNDIYRVNAYANNGFLTLPSADAILRLPASPFLRFEESPFYKVLDIIIPPTIMTPSENNFTPGNRIYERLLVFRINPDQAETITYHSHRLDGNRRSFGVQVLMRFGKLESSMLPKVIAASSPDADRSNLAPFVDSMPIHLSVLVNTKQAVLPPLLPTCRSNMDGRRHGRPVNITPLIRVSPYVSNHVKLSWRHDYSTFCYNFFAVYLVQKLSTKELCEALRAHSYQSAPAVKKQIVEKLASNVTSFGGGNGIGDESDDDLQIQNTLPVQLLCPLSKCRIKLPVRGQNCQHIQCYDADTYLLINERKPSWKCPVCDSITPFRELFVDGLLMEILASKLSENVEEIVFNDDGSWTHMRSSTTSGTSRRSQSPSLSTDDIVHTSQPTSGAKRSNSGGSNENTGDLQLTIDLTGSDDEVEPAVKRQPPTAITSLPSEPLGSTLPLTQVSAKRVAPVPLGYHDSLSTQRNAYSHHLQQNHYRNNQQHNRTVTSSNSSIAYAHFNPPSSISTLTYPADSKPRLVCPDSRPCSHSATPSPRTPLSLSHSSATGSIATKPNPLQSATTTAFMNPFPYSVSTTAANFSVSLAATKELFLKMTTLYPQLTPQQIGQVLAALKMHEHNYCVHQPHAPPPPKAAHQNNSSLPSRRSFLPPTPAHTSSLPLSTQQWRTHTTTNCVFHLSSSSGPLFLTEGASSSSILDFWPSTLLSGTAAAVTSSTVNCHRGQSLGLYGASLSPPQAHSNHSSSPPRKGDPRHLEGGFLDLPHPPGWSTPNR